MIDTVRLFCYDWFCFLAIWTLSGAFVFNYVNSMRDFAQMKTSNFAFMCLVVGPVGWLMLLAAVVNGLAASLVGFIKEHLLYQEE